MKLDTTDIQSELPPDDKAPQSSNLVWFDVCNGYGPIEIDNARDFRKGQLIILTIALAIWLLSVAIYQCLRYST